MTREEYNNLPSFVPQNEFKGRQKYKSTSFTNEKELIIEKISPTHIKIYDFQEND